jgi:hypothetical protein
MLTYEQAYLEYYQVPANLRYKKGWYYLNGKRYLHHQMERKLALLFAKLQELESPNPDRQEFNYD